MEVSLEAGYTLTGAADLPKFAVATLCYSSLRTCRTSGRLHSCVGMRIDSDRHYSARELKTKTLKG